MTSLNLADQGFSKKERNDTEGYQIQLMVLHASRGKNFSQGGGGGQEGTPLQRQTSSSPLSSSSGSYARDPNGARECQLSSVVALGTYKTRQLMAD